MKSIALISVTGVQVAEHCAALMHSKALLETVRPVEKVILFSYDPPVGAFDGIWVKTHFRFDIQSYGRFQVRQIGKIWDEVIGTDFMLNIQADGFVTNPRHWTETFTDYDYIGAPWARPQVGGKDSSYGDRVGNSGFSLRSANFMKGSAISYDHRDCVDSEIFTPYDDEGDDIYWCQTLSGWLEFYRAVRFAPVDVAARFSLEQDIPEYPARTVDDCFGQHGRKRFRF